MKCKKYIILAVSFTFALLFAACESDWVDPLVSPSVEIKNKPTISQSELTIVFTPSRTVANFEYALGDETDREAFLNGTFPGIVRVDNGETTEVKFPGLTPNKVYTLYARGYSSNGTAGPLASIKEKIRTISTDITAEVQFESVNSLAVTVTSNINFYKYEFALGFERDQTDFEDGSLAGITSKEEFSTHTANYFDLQPETEYIFFVRAYDRISNLPTETLKLPVRTAAPGTVPTVDCTITHIDLYSGKYLITPNELVGKVGVATGLQGIFDDAINEEINWKGDIRRMLNSWTNAGSNAGYVSIGYDKPFTFEFTTPEMILGQYDPYNYPIEAFVIVYDKNNQPFSVQKFNFHTPAFNNDAKEATAGLKISNITNKGALYEFTPNDQAIGIFFETFLADWVHETMQSDYYYEGFLEQYLYQYGYWSYVHNVPTSTFPERNAEPGKQYYVFYMCMNANGPDGFGPLKYQVYETLPEEE